MKEIWKSERGMDNMEERVHPAGKGISEENIEIALSVENKRLNHYYGQSTAFSF